MTTFQGPVAVGMLIGLGDGGPQDGGAARALCVEESARLLLRLFARSGQAAKEPFGGHVEGDELEPVSVAKDVDKLSHGVAGETDLAILPHATGDVEDKHVVHALVADGFELLAGGQHQAEVAVLAFRLACDQVEASPGTLSLEAENRVPCQVSFPRLKAGLQELGRVRDKANAKSAGWLGLCLPTMGISDLQLRSREKVPSVR